MNTKIYKYFFSIFFIFIILSNVCFFYKNFNLIISADSNNYSGGTGTIIDPYKISSVNDLKSIKTNIATIRDKYFVLTNDITLNDTNWTDSIGNNTAEFIANFDGQNHVINFNNTKHGLFGHINNANIKNIKMQGKVVFEDSHETIDALKVNPGLLFLSAINSTIDNIINNTNVQLKQNQNNSTIIYGNIGSLIKNCTINNCINSGSCSSVSNKANDFIVGGIIGEAYAVNTDNFIINCSNNGNIRDFTSIGGIIGRLGTDQSTASIINCINKGILTNSKNIGQIANTSNGSLYLYNCIGFNKKNPLVYISSNPIHITFYNCLVMNQEFTINNQKITPLNPDEYIYNINTNTFTNYNRKTFSKKEFIILMNTQVQDINKTIVVNKIQNLKKWIFNNNDIYFSDNYETKLNNSTSQNFLILIIELGATIIIGGLLVFLIIRNIGSLKNAY